MTIRKLIALLLACTMVLGLAACSTTPAPTSPPTTAATQATTAPTTQPTTAPTEPTPTKLSAGDRYAQAVDQLNAATDFTMNIRTQRTVTINGESYVEEAEQTVTYTGYGTEDFAARMQETADIDGYITAYDETFLDGTMYTLIDDSYRFRGAMTAEEYTARFAPVQMLDAALYDEITADGDTLYFSVPTAGESWIVPEYAQLTDARGTAALDAEGALAGYTYAVTYTIGGAEIQYEIQMTFDASAAIELVPIDDEEAYFELEYVDAPRLMEQAAGYLYQTYSGHSASTSMAESILSYAAGCIRNQVTTINTWGDDSDYMADIDISVYMMAAGQEFSFDQVEHFQNGVYTLSQDGSDPEAHASVTASMVQSYCVSVYTSSVPQMYLLTNATATDLGSIYYLELEFNDEMAKTLSKSISNILFQDEDFLDDLASEFSVTTMTGYLAIDKLTGLPTALGYYFEGVHTIDGDDYMLSLQSDQSFDLASTSAYEDITEELPPVAEPEEKATPLFYHVTGENGQEMWLLGTIHIGDARTSYLPQEIYDAFDAADALAVEFNSEAFSEALDNDEELSDQVSDCYFYGDGTQVVDHIEDSELYEYAEKLVKATGNYHMNAPYLKAYFWSQSIENFYLRQSYDLSSTQGVDNQLIHRAMAAGKTIMDVESGLFQIQMLSGFSEALQEELLAGSVSSDPLEYANSTRELFEMWCAGDEAALIEYLTDDGDTSELTEEELALLEEYNNAMGTDRNDDMLDVAIGYLESGEVVFYAVGLAHLLAEDGLVNTLRDAGYTVELVPYE